VKEALARHTWFSRLFEITRTDAVVSWWVGSRAFLGEDPPARLTAWPELRRVNVAKTPRPLMDLPMSGGSVDYEAFAATVSRFLTRTPLTDLATCDRAAPRFQWTHEALQLVTSRAGRTLALRAMQRGSADAFDAALGRATKALLVAREWKAAAIALDVLGERALAAAAALLPTEVAASPPQVADDGAFGRGAGAFMAHRWLAMHGDCFAPTERAKLVAILTPMAQSSGARELEQLLTPALGPTA
jgi:hypothetical protein